MIERDDVESFLMAEGYSVWQSSALDGVTEFEDAALFGFSLHYANVKELLRKWQSDHDQFLKFRADRIRHAAEKRPNLYAVFLTSGEADNEQMNDVIAIEENFIASRKIVGSKIGNSKDLRKALLPLSRLGAKPTIEKEDLDERLRSRLPDNRLLEVLRTAEGTKDFLARVLSE
jgi:hypothetical protein